jgi:cell division protein FtsQ
MRRLKKQPLRGSVTQNNARVRMRAKELTPFGFMFRLGALVGSVMLILGLAAWLWHIGWPQRQAEHLLQAGLHVTQQARFSVKDIIVEGRRQTDRNALSTALGIGAGAPIFGFDPAAAQARIAKLPWVASVAVERLLPDTIFVRLTERQPLARWQHEGRTVVIDMQGQELPDADPGQFAELPLVVGADAPPETRALLDALKDYPAVADKMTAAVRVGGRRWDLHLQQKIIARMPEAGLEGALKLLSGLIVDKKILERDITAIDLRLPDRLIIESAHPISAHPDGDMRL